MPAATNPTRSAPVTHASPGPAADVPIVNNLERCPIGSVVRATVPSGPSACESNTLEGEVLAYDPSKVLVLKCSSSSGRPSLFNVHMINLTLPCDWKVVTEKRDPAPEPPSLNVNRLYNRQREQVERKKKQIMAFKAGVSPTGQKLFQAIGKTIDDVSWNGDSIVVMREVTISPPYKPDDVKGTRGEDSKALRHVRKIVEKYISDQQLVAGTPSSSAVTTGPNYSQGSGASCSTSARTSPPAPDAGERERPTSGRGGNRSQPKPLSAGVGHSRTGDHSMHSDHHNTSKQPFNQPRIVFRAEVLNLDEQTGRS